MNQQQALQQSQFQGLLSSPGIDPRAMALASEVLGEQPGQQGCVSQEAITQMAYRIDQAMRGFVQPPRVMFMPSFLF